MAGTAQEAARTRQEGTAQGLGSRRWWVLAVMSVGALIIFIDNTVVNTALPRIALDLGASTSTLQWVIDSYVLLLAGQEPDSRIPAGSEIGLENTLKVETRVRTPLGLPAQRSRSGH
jgi:hypothetical protein